MQGETRKGTGETRKAKTRNGKGEKRKGKARKGKGEKREGENLTRSRETRGEQRGTGSEDNLRESRETEQPREKEDTKRDVGKNVKATKKEAGKHKDDRRDHRGIRPGVHPGYSNRSPLCQVRVLFPREMLQVAWCGRIGRCDRGMAKTPGEGRGGTTAGEAGGGDRPHLLAILHRPMFPSACVMGGGVVSARLDTVYSTTQQPG